MPEPLKSFFTVELIKRLAKEIAQVHPAFPSRVFIRQASDGLEEKELLDRARQIARALSESLPPDYPQALSILLRSLGPPHERDELEGAGMAPFFYLPHTIFVAERGLDHFDLSMQAQHTLTQRFTAEFSVRFFIAKDPERAIASLRKWAEDPSAHVRRLVSEGTRLRLPWAMRVRWLDENPEQILSLLELLKDDPTTLVRRSVANNLNDLGKVHPALLHATCASWLEDASPERRALVEHALRSAIKRGDPQALRLLGYGQAPKVELASVRFEPKRVRIGDRVTVTFELRSTAKKPQDLLVDLIVHFVKASGRSSPKVFKLERLNLEPGRTAKLSTRISLAVHTTRKPCPGRHAVEVLVNGERLPAGQFTVIERPNGARVARS